MCTLERRSDRHNANSEFFSFPNELRSMGPNDAHGISHGKKWYLRFGRGISIWCRPGVIIGCLQYLRRHHCCRFCTIRLERHGTSVNIPHRNHANFANLCRRPAHSGDSSIATRGGRPCDLVLCLHDAHDRTNYWGDLHAALKARSRILEACRWTKIDLRIPCHRCHLFTDING